MVNNHRHAIFMRTFVPLQTDPFVKYGRSFVYHSLIFLTYAKPISDTEHIWLKGEIRQRFWCSNSFGERTILCRQKNCILDMVHSRQHVSTTAIAIVASSRNFSANGVFFISNSTIHGPFNKINDSHVWHWALVKNKSSWNRTYLRINGPSQWQKLFGQWSPHLNRVHKLELYWAGKRQARKSAAMPNHTRTVWIKWKSAHFIWLVLSSLFEISREKKTQKQTRTVRSSNCGWLATICTRRSWYEYGSSSSAKSYSPRRNSRSDGGTL